MPEFQELRERIITKAHDRFRVEGFSRVTVDDLASSLAISKKTFYVAFESKNELVELIVRSRLNNLRRGVEEILSGEGTFVLKLHRVMGFLATFLTQTGFPLMVDVQRYMPELWNEVENFRARKVEDFFGQLLDQGIREGFIRKDLNRAVFLNAYLASIRHIMQPAYLANESFSAQDALHAIINIFFAGAMSERGRKEFEKIQ